MREFVRAAVLIATVSTCGCQTIPREDLALCSKIAQFANSTSDSTTHAIELTTDWGGQFAEKSPDKITLSQKTCNHFGYQPGSELCSFLLENTSTEFPDANVNSTMVCLGAGKPAKMVYDLDYGNTVLWSHVARGVDPEILVGIEYSVGTDAAPPSLKIMVRKDL